MSGPPRRGEGGGGGAGGTLNEGSDSRVMCFKSYLAFQLAMDLGLSALHTRKAVRSCPIFPHAPHHLAAVPQALYC